MPGHELGTAETVKDLGVHISNNLKSANRCYEPYQKANRMLELVNRTIKHRHPDLMVWLHKSLVRPHLEYCSPVWNPHYKKDIMLLKKVKHRFTRFFDNLKDMEDLLGFFSPGVSSFSFRLRKLKLWTLQDRRNQADLIELFKMVRGISTVPMDSFFLKYWYIVFNINIS